MNNIVTKLITLVFTLLITSQAFGQKVYVYAGGNMSKMLIEDNRTIYSRYTNYRNGLKFGLSVEMPYMEHLGVLTGIDYSAKGFANKVVGTNGNSIETDFSVQYLSVPLAIRLTVPAEYITILAQAGIFGSYALNAVAESNYKLSDFKGTEREELDLEADSFQQYDYGLSAGFGFELRNIQVVVSYDLSVANFVDTAKYVNPSTNMGHRAFSLTIGYNLINLFGGK